MPLDTTPLITLTTDFGTQDAYVPAMKGVLLSICPAARLVDITHEIAPQDIMEAGFVLREAVPYFPDGTIHLVVIDPGVGTGRRPVALRHNGQCFVGPDNGIFSLLLGKEPPDALVELDRPDFWRTAEPSRTFHGRDIFAPAAAHLAGGCPLNELGSLLPELHTLHWALPIPDEEGIRGWVVHIDHFGNCITNIPAELFQEQRRERPVKCFVGNAVLRELQPTYGAVDEGDPLLLFGSSGFLEIAVNTGNAATLLDIRKGAPVNVVFVD